MILKHGLWLSGIGVAIGLALSLAFGRSLTAGLGAPSFNMPALVLVTLGLVTMAVASAFVPARRASRLDPITVLRQE